MALATFITWKYLMKKEVAIADNLLYVNLL